MIITPTKKRPLAEEDDAEQLQDQAVALSVTSSAPHRKKSQPKRAGCLAGKPTTTVHKKTTTTVGEKTATGPRGKSTKERRGQAAGPGRGKPTLPPPPALPKMVSGLAGTPETSLHGKPTTGLHAAGQKVETRLTEPETARRPRKAGKKEGPGGPNGISIELPEEKKKRPPKKQFHPTVLETTVYVAAYDIPKGQMIEAGDLRAVSIPRNKVPHNAITNPGAVIGKPARITIPRMTILKKNMVAGTVRETVMVS